MVAVAGGVLAAATAAKAETCVTLPGTTGATIEVAGRQVRVPATSGVAACVEPGGLPGLPRIDSGGGTTSIVLGAGSNASGYVAVRYALDGSPNEIRVPIPGAGNPSEICLASVGEIARPDCLVKVSIDDIPPIPTPPPTPTVPPVPTVPPTPTIRPLPDPWCNDIYCINEPPDPWCNDIYCINEPPDPWSNQWYCIVDPGIIEPICFTKFDICIP
ncbi:MAG: hypothetical protein M3217_07535 [Actinomycetota bacterium]|nr:hypothetical protein [Actinomycetota bacterium]